MFVLTAVTAHGSATATLPVLVLMQSFKNIILQHKNNNNLVLLCFIFVDIYDDVQAAAQWNRFVYI